MAKEGRRGFTGQKSLPSDLFAVEKAARKGKAEARVNEWMRVLNVLREQAVHGSEKVTKGCRYHLQRGTIKSG